MSEVTDMVNHPPHYKDESGIECIEVTKHMQFCGGNCFKYLYRAGKKGSTIEDLKKAAWYAEHAWIMNELNVNADWCDNIYSVAHSRSGKIKGAMVGIAKSDWSLVQQYISEEITRLEANQ